MSEAEVLAKYSSPSLRRNELTRFAKKLHLQSMAKKMGLSPADIEETLARLYPKTSNE